jgi:hypothetical protein
MQGAHRRPAPAAARLVAVLAAVCLVALSRHASVLAMPAGTLTMTPSAQSLNIGDSVLVTVQLSGATNVNDVAFRVTFNPAVVSVTDYDLGTAGIQILPGWFPGTDLNYQTEGSVITNLVNPAGQINYEYQLSGGGEVSGGGTVATVQFVAQANGNADIQWSWVQLKDGGGTPTTPSLGTPSNIVVGGPVPTSTATSTATVTPTPTNTPAVTATATPTLTSTPQPSATATPTGTPSPGTTATPRVTVVANTNAATATPSLARPPAGDVEPSTSGRAGGLPSAGNDGGGPGWWRWMFFAGALMMAGAGWFFTFAVHTGHNEPVLTDRFDRLRRRRH